MVTIKLKTIKHFALPLLLVPAVSHARPVTVINPFAISTPITVAIGSASAANLASLELIRQAIGSGSAGNLSALSGSEIATSSNAEMASQAAAEMQKIERLSEAERGFALPVDPCVTGDTPMAIHGSSVDAAKNMGGGGSGRGGASKRKKTEQDITAATPPSTDQFLSSASSSAPESVDKNVVTTAKIHREKFCTAEEIAHPAGRVMCEGKVGQYPNANVQVSSLLSGAKPSNKPAGENLSFTGDQQNIAKIYTTMVTKPNGVYRALTATEAKHPAAVQYFGLMKEYEARTNVGEYVFDNALAIRTPSKKTAAYLESIEGYVGSEPWYQERKAANNNYKNGLSQLDMIDLDVMRRYGNTKWLEDLAQMENKDAEIAAIGAQTNYILMLQFRQMELANLIQAQALITRERDYFAPIFSSIDQNIRSTGGSQSAAK